MNILKWIQDNLPAVLGGVSVVLMLVVVFGLKGIVERNHDSDLERCDRDNLSRSTAYKDRRDEIEQLEAQLGWWETLQRHGVIRQLEQVPEIRPTFATYLDGLRTSIHNKRMAIKGTVEAQAEVAVKKGSVVVDCSKAYP